VEREWGSQRHQGARRTDCSFRDARILSITASSIPQLKRLIRSVTVRAIRD
jgi:hypothetical protein